MSARPRVAALAVALCLCAPARGQDYTRAGGVATIGTVAPDCTFCGTDDLVFQAAVDRFVGEVVAGPVHGVELVVLPGVYRFNHRVDLPAEDAQGVPMSFTVRGTGGAVLVCDPAANPDGILRVLGNGFRLSGVTLRSVNHPDRPTLLLVQGDDFEVRDCTFWTREDACASSGARFLLDVGYPDPTDPCASAVPRFVDGRVEGCTFLFEVPGPCTPPTLGLCVGIRARNGFNLRVLDNEFLGVDATGAEAPGGLKHAIELHDTWFGSIAGNSFRQLFNAGWPGAAIVSIDNTALPEHCDDKPHAANDEGHHQAILGNTFEGLGADWAIEIRGQGFHALTGNQLVDGRGGIRLAGGAADVIAGNLFQGMGVRAGVSALPAIALDGVTRVNVNGNLFDDCDGTQVRAADDARVLQLVSNRFVRPAGSPAGALRPIDLAGADFVSVHANLHEGPWPDAVLFEPPAARDATVDAANNHAWIHP